MLTNRNTGKNIIVRVFNDSLLDIRYSLFNCIRYYWPHTGLKIASRNDDGEILRRGHPTVRISQYLPKQFERIQSGIISNTASADYG
ncbi:class II D-tagatose-bisphosphate aldolase non-catalytic subunit [Escherichia coli]